MAANGSEGFGQLKARAVAFLKTWQGKVVAGGVVVVLVLIAIFAFSGHSASYQRGHDAGLGDIPADPNPDDWCREALEYARADNPNTNHSDFIEGCMAGIKDRNRA